MKRILVLLFALFIGISLSAQEADTIKYWKIGGNISLTFNQISFTNWSAGGKNSLSGLGSFSLTAKYAKDRSFWDTYLNTAYGLQKVGDDPKDKTEDKFDLSSTYGYQLKNNWFASANLSFNTQYDEGFDPDDDTVLVSDLLSPAYLVVGLGITYKPCEYFNVSLSPITYKMTAVNNQDLANEGNYGLDPADTVNNVVINSKKVRHEFGASLKAVFEKEVVKNVKLGTLLELFSNYSEDPQNIDVKWDVYIDMKINNFLTAQITTNLIYDHDIRITDKDGNTGPRTQFKETLGIGLIYRFGEKIE